MVHSDKLMAKSGSLGLVGREQPQVQQPGERLELPDRGESMSLFVFVLPEPLLSLRLPSFLPRLLRMLI